MKDSGIKWIGEIPKEYKISKIKYVSDIFGRIGFRGYTEKDLVDGEEEGAITLSPSNLNNMKMDYTKCTYLNWKKYEESPEIKINNGDVLFVKTGSTYGKSAYVTNLPKEATINPQLVVFKNIKINNKLFSYILQTKIIKIQSELAVFGSVIPTMSQEKIYNFIIPLPPIEEQKKISAYLDEKCEHIDAIIEGLKKQIETLKEYKKSLITETVTKGLNNNVKMKDSGVEWVGDIPEHWEVKKLKYITVQRNEKGLFKSNQDIYIGLENVMSYSDTLLETSSEYEDSIQSVCHAGDIMFNKLRPYLAKVIIAPYNCFCTGEFLQFCSFNGDNRFLRYFMLSDRFIKIVNASTYGVKMPRANTDFIINLLMTYPPIEEQKAIADYLDEKCTEIDKIISEKKQQIETIEEYKKSLIFEYVTGKKEL
ncbi:MAG: restriction endonuclease subunit S [Alistipes senegalensis]|nr:restriction endonuclease subunit S [Alistipes senegalensis]